MYACRYKTMNNNIFARWHRKCSAKTRRSLDANCGVHATASDENKGPYTDAQGKQIAATQAATSMLKAL
jgi:hypothetical protein